MNDFDEDYDLYHPVLREYEIFKGETSFDITESVRSSVLSKGRFRKVSMISNQKNENLASIFKSIKEQVHISKGMDFSM